MAQMSDYLEEQLMNFVFRANPDSFVTPGLVHLALYSSDPTDANSGTELTVGTSPGYARMSVGSTLGAPTDGVSTNESEILFAAATGDWVTITHMGILDEATGGNLLMHQALAASVDVLDTNNFRVPIGNLTVTFA